MLKMCGVHLKCIQVIITIFMSRAAMVSLRVPPTKFVPILLKVFSRPLLGTTIAFDQVPMVFLKKSLEMVKNNTGLEGCTNKIPPI